MVQLTELKQHGKIVGVYDSYGNYDQQYMNYLFSNKRGQYYENQKLLKTEKTLHKLIEDLKVKEFTERAFSFMAITLF